MAKKDEERPIIIKRIKKGGAGHHGGAWKVAYADFTTAMMAFFMLLWLLNVTTEEQRKGLADYFAPTSASTSDSSGAGGVLGGTSLSKEGSMASGAVVLTMPKPSEPPQASAPDKDDQASQPPAVNWQKAQAAKEDQAFKALETDLRQSIQAMPDLADLAEHMVIDVTKDGMRIQLIDKDGRSMFKPSTDELYGYARKMLREIAVRVEKMPNRIDITGHTDAKGFVGKDGYTNWELSADRANAARRVLKEAGVPEDRFSTVRGKASTDPLLPESPDRPENRRISILLLREAPVVPPKF